MEELTVGRVPDVSEEKKPEPCAHTHNIFFFFSCLQKPEPVQGAGNQADPRLPQRARTDVPAHVWRLHPRPEIRFVNQTRRITPKTLHPLVEFLWGYWSVPLLATSCTTKAARIHSGDFSMHQCTQSSHGNMASVCRGPPTEDHMLSRGGESHKTGGGMERIQNILKHFKQTYLCNCSNMSGWNIAGSVIKPL